jgi:hypothetical protein
VVLANLLLQVASACKMLQGLQVTMLQQQMACIYPTVLQQAVASSHSIAIVLQQAAAARSHVKALQQDSRMALLSTARPLVHSC